VEEEGRRRELFDAYLAAAAQVGRFGKGLGSVKKGFGVDDEQGFGPCQIGLRTREG
jgi:hypothetical protein